MSLTVAAQQSGGKKGGKGSVAPQPVQTVIHPPQGGTLIPWQPGQSGNPGGRSKLEHEMMKRCREFGPAAASFLKSVVEDKAVDGEGKRMPADIRERIVAVGMVLDRGFGKPREPKDGDRTPMRPDLSSLSSSDITALKKIFGKIAYRAPEGEE